MGGFGRIGDAQCMNDFACCDLGNGCIYVLHSMEIEGCIIYFISFDIYRSSPTWCVYWVIACIAHHLVELVYVSVRDVKLPISCVCATKAHVACPSLNRKRRLIKSSKLFGVSLSIILSRYLTEASHSHQEGSKGVTRHHTRSHP